MDRDDSVGRDTKESVHRRCHPQFETTIVTIIRILDLDSANDHIWSQLVDVVDVLCEIDRLCSHEMRRVVVQILKKGILTT